MTWKKKLHVQLCIILSEKPKSRNSQKISATKAFGSFIPTESKSTKPLCKNSCLVPYAVDASWCPMYGGDFEVEF
jgi:hypothetical protein